MGVTALTGDRLKEGCYKALEELSSDAVIDAWQDETRAVTSAVEALQSGVSTLLLRPGIIIRRYENTPLALPGGFADSSGEVRHWPLCRQTVNCSS